MEGIKTETMCNGNIPPRCFVVNLIQIAHNPLTNPPRPERNMHYISTAPQGNQVIDFFYRAKQ